MWDMGGIVWDVRGIVWDMRGIVWDMRDGDDAEDRVLCMYNNRGVCREKRVLCTYGRYCCYSACGDINTQAHPQAPSCLFLLSLCACAFHKFVQ